MNRVVTDDANDAVDSDDGVEQDSDVVVEVDDILPEIITAELPPVAPAPDADSDDDDANEPANESNEPEENAFYQNPDQLALMYLHSKGLREWPTDINQIEWIKKCIDLPPAVIDISDDAPAKAARARTNDIIDLSVDVTDIPNIPTAMIAPAAAIGSRSNLPLQHQIERQNSTNYAIW